jgi:3-hydroxyacyl-[acyl-carrier-protein] dehydratase
MAGFDSIEKEGGAGLVKLKNEEGLFFLASIEKAKFRRQVRPGGEIRMEIVNES